MYSFVSNNHYWTIVFLIFWTGLTLGQNTFYVDNIRGSDSRNGLSPQILTPEDLISGPKKTISGTQGALSLANPGDIIIISNSGKIYNANSGELQSIIIDIPIIIKSSDGVPEINSEFVVDITYATSGKIIEFGGSGFKFTNRFSIISAEPVVGCNIELMGTEFILGENISILGTGKVTLNPAEENLPMTISTIGELTIANLVIAGDIELNGSKLLATNSFVHTKGDINLLSSNLQVDGTFQRINGTYSSQTGYLIINNNLFVTGESMSVPNLQFGVGGAVSPELINNITVTNNLRLNTNSGDVKISNGSTKFL